LDNVEVRNCENFKIVPAPFVTCAGTDWNRSVAVSRAVVALIVGSMPVPDWRVAFLALPLS